MSKTIRLNATPYFIMKIPNKRELWQTVSNHLSEIDFKDFMKLYKEYTKEPYSFLVNGITLSSEKKNWVLVRKLKQSITKSIKTNWHCKKQYQILDRIYESDETINKKSTPQKNNKSDLIYSINHSF